MKCNKMNIGPAHPDFIHSSPDFTQVQVAGKNNEKVMIQFTGPTAKRMADDYIKFQEEDTGCFGFSLFLDTQPTPQMVFRSGKQAHMYEVGIVTPVFETTILVMAENEEAAMNQARLPFEIERYKLDKEIQNYIHLHATKVPFLIQGWSACKF